MGRNVKNFAPERVAPGQKRAGGNIAARPRALPKPANAKIALIKEEAEAIFASCVSCTCSLRSLTSM